VPSDNQRQSLKSCFNYLEVEIYNLIAQPEILSGYKVQPDNLKENSHK
jgi:hypothetical protein